MVDFLLASASPRRREILENLGFRFKVVPAPDIDEEAELVNSLLKPDEIALKLAEKKSLSLNPADNELMLTADTVVAIGSKTYGKPADDDEAESFLADLSGRKHQVITAIALKKGPDKPVMAFESTDVYFAPMTPDDIKWYVATGEPFGKAGGYAIQGKAGIFIPKIDGCYFNVVGLPVFKLLWLLSQTGYDYREFFTCSGGEE